MTSSSTSQASCVAFIGAGLIGGSLAQAMATRGDHDRIVVYNRTRQKAEELDGVEVADSAADAARAADTFVHITMSEDDALDAVLSDEELLDVLSERDVILIDHTTASPQGTTRRQERLAARGIQMVHAPVFMSPAACLDAQGVMIASGPSELIEQVRDHLAAMTGEFIDLGERVDAAASYKLFGNALIISLTGAMADVYTMAEQMGFSRKEAFKLIGFFNPGNTLKGRGKRMAEEDYSTSFEVSMARKDVRLMIEAAGEQGDALITLPAVAARLDALIERGHGDEDLGAIARQFKKS